MDGRRLTWWMVLALAVGVIAGVAVAQDGTGHGRGGRECVGGEHVVRSRPAPPDAMRACTASTDCVVVDASCCGTCGVPGVSQVRAVRRDQTAAYHQHQCRHSQNCPACVTRPPPASLHAACVAHLCEVTTPDAACGAASPYGVGQS